MQELIRFKKNPRYVEIVTRIVEWCLDRDLVEAALRISADTEDWLDKRTQTIVQMDMMADEGDTKREVVIKRRKRHLFATDKKLILENVKSTKAAAAANKQAKQQQKRIKEQEEINRKAEEARRKAKEAREGKDTKDPKDKKDEKRVAKDKKPGNDPTKPLATKPSGVSQSNMLDSVVAEDQSKNKNTRTTPPTSAGSGSKETDPTASGPETTASRPSSRPTSRGSETASRPSSGTSSPNSQSRNNSRANSASPKATSREEISKEDPDQSTFLVIKRKRLQQRHAYFVGLSPAERERKDHAARVLDIQLSSLWHRRRYLRRLRAMLSYEATWKSHLSFLRAKSLQHQVQKELSSWHPNTSDVNEFFDSEWFEFRRSGTVLLNALNISKTEGYSTTTDNDLTIGSNGMIAEMLQSFVQSAVIASRASEWLKFAF
eukprot:jgi/Hompol1/1749/HPOL_000005-RA